MDLIILASEISTDPQGRGYAGMTDQQVADDLNTVYRQRQRELVNTYEIIGATIPAEWAALTTAEKQRYQTLIAAGQLRVADDNVRDAFLAMFNNQSATRSALAALQYETISRANELGLGLVYAGHVAMARAGGS